MREKIFLLFALLFSLQLSAQNVTDGLRFANFDYSGTARFMAAGGAMGPLGADLSVASTNPAGLALFRKSEFTVTPALFTNNTDASLLTGGGNGFLEDSKTTFGLSNIGAVVVSQPLSKRWKSMNFAVTLNRTANFNRTLNYEGRSTGSITDRYQELANSGIGTNSFETGLAADAGAIYDFNDDGFYDIDYELAPNADLLRAQQITESGSISEFAFSLAGNFDEILMFGLTLGVPIVNYEIEREYSEEDIGNAAGGDVPFFSDLALRETVTTTGGGINAKLGLILRVNQALRLSGAVHTPTGYTLEDDFETNLDYNYYENEDETGAFLGGTGVQQGLFEYDLSSPWRFFGGAGLLLGKNGFISGEIEYVDYSNVSFSYDGFADAERLVNGDIDTQLESVVNLRLGGELVYDIFRFRAGFGVFPSAYANDDSNRYTYSAGVGFREDRWFLDLAYRHTSYDEFYLPYVVEDTNVLTQQEVETNYSLNNVAVTFGVKF